MYERQCRRGNTSRLISNATHTIGTIKVDTDIEEVTDFDGGSDEEELITCRGEERSRGEKRSDMITSNMQEVSFLPHKRSICVISSLSRQLWL